MNAQKARVIDHHQFPQLMKLMPRVRRDGAGEEVAALLDRAVTLALVVEDLRDAEQILLGHTARSNGVSFAQLAGGPKAAGAVVLLGTFQQYLHLANVLREEHGSLGDVSSAIKGAIYRFRERAFTLTLPDGADWELGGRALVMGVLNVTPDSFSDGGDHVDPDRAVARALEMVEEGADLIDVGGESTRPGATPVSPAEEQARILPVIERLTERISVPISVDTRRGTTAREALKAGAAIVNDVSGLEDPLTGGVAARAGAPLILMHMRGTPEDMSDHSNYEDVVREVAVELSVRMRRALDAGVEETQILIDPGIGFAKTSEQSLALIRRLGEIRSLGRPILVGPSRKSFLSAVKELPAKERLSLTLGAVLAAVANGAHIVRVHDVRPAVEAIRAFEACRT